MKVWDRIDLCSSDSEKEDEKVPPTHLFKSSLANPTLPCAYDARISTSTRPPFFQLYDSVQAKLSSAQQSKDCEAVDFYRHIKDWFLYKTKEDGFDPLNFDYVTVERHILNYGDATKRLDHAKATFQRGSMHIYALELKCIIDECKRTFPIAKIKAETPIKCEYN